MPKYIYLIRIPQRVKLEEFEPRIFDGLVPGLLQLNPEKLKVHLTETKRPGFAVLPLKSDNLVMISVWDNHVHFASIIKSFLRRCTGYHGLTV